MLVSQILVIFPRSLSQARHQISDKHIIKDHLKALRRNYDLVTEDFKAEECGANVEGGLFLWNPPRVFEASQKSAGM